MSYEITLDKDAMQYIVDTPTEGAKRKLKKFRRDIGYEISHYIKQRILKRGMGAYGPLKGYSTKPFKFRKGKKRMWEEDNLNGQVIKGGYLEYRNMVGIPSQHFMFSNMGNAWNDWDFSVDDSTGQVVIGFSDVNNAEAARQAMDNGRPDMFELNDNELNMILGKLIDDFEYSIIGGK